MGFLDRIFGKKRAANAGTTADLARSQPLTDQARSQQLAGHETGQTTAEQADTRGRMEAELLGQRQRREPPSASTATTETPPCLHTALVPRWHSVADMGKEDKVTSYTCEGCQASFTAEEGHTLRATEAARVQRELGI